MNTTPKPHYSAFDDSSVDNHAESFSGMAARGKPGIPREQTESGLISGHPHSEEVVHQDVRRHPCPNCHSLHTRRRRRHSWERFIFFFSNHRPFHCESCGATFYASKYPGQKSPSA
jgi:ribosomal protein L37AE/L43A